MIFPLFSIDKNSLTSIKGDESSFYKITPPDLEQIEDIELFLSSVQEWLVALDASHFFKFYSHKNSIYLNTNFDELDIPNSKCVSCNRPLDLFFKDGLYSEINFYEDYHLFNQIYGRILSVKDLPDDLPINHLSGIGDFVINLQKIDSVKARESLNLKRRLHFSSLFKNIRNIESENSYKEAETILEDVIKGMEALFNVEIFFILRAKAKDELDQLTKDALRRAKEFDLTLRIESSGNSYFFANILPGVKPTFKRKLLIPASYLKTMLPLHGDFVMDDGITFLSKNANKIQFNIFDQRSHNYNLLITGSSGQGKSMLANKLIHEELNNNTKAVILDLGGSFNKLTKFHGGVSFNSKFNPLEFKDPKYLLAFVLSIVKDPLTFKDQGKLLKTIKTYLKGDNLSFEKLVNYLEKSFNGISYYFEDILPFVNDSTSIKRDITYCDFSEYPENIKAPLIIFLIEYFKNLYGKKIFVFDECWHLLQKNGDYISECFRTFRKYQASAIAISQNIDDFTQSHLGKVIVQNSFYKLIFRQDISDTGFINSFTLSQLEDIYSKKRAYGEFIINFEETSKPARFYPTSLEYELFTSDREDNLKLSKYLNKAVDLFEYKDAFLNYVAVKDNTKEFYEN